MTKEYIELGDSVFFWFAVNDTAGSGTDGASAAIDVRLAGAAASAAPVHSPSASLLSHANYPAGLYEVQIDATVANGYSANSTYAVFATIAADSQNPSGYLGSFSIGKLQTAADLGILKETTIATLASQTSFTLTAGSDQDSAYSNRLAWIQDADNADRIDPVWISNYAGSTRTVTLNAGVGTFTAAVGDKIVISAHEHPGVTQALLTNIQGRLPSALDSGYMQSSIKRVRTTNVGSGTGVLGDEWGP